MTLANDANAVYEYDLGNRLTKLTNHISDTNSIVFEYNSYDNVGNRLSFKIDDANAHVYTYDDLYQLTFVDYNDSNSTTYGYDSLGNRTSADGTAYLRNCLNQYTAVDGNSYIYDANGNLTNDSVYKYTYNCENRLMEVKDQNDTAVASYKYDLAGRRVLKTVSGTTTKYVYDGDQIIAEYEDGDLARKFIYGPGIDEPVCMIVGASTYYYHFDGLGSVAALSDDGGDIIERYSYDVFGEPNRTSNINNPYFFTGRAYDAETGLYYYRARYYTPSIGRFLQTDPIGYKAGINLYTYCLNNPVNWTDPYGLWVIGIGVGGSGGYGLGGTAGVQYVFDSHGNSGIFIHAGAGGYLGASSGGGIDVTVASGSAYKMNGAFNTTGGSGGELLVMGGEYHNSGWGGERGGTFHVGVGGGTPVEGHSYVEVGQFFDYHEIMSPEIIMGYWKDVGMDFWDWLKDTFGSDEKGCK